MLADANIGLVHRRLSIIDVAGGAQPISDADKKFQIIGNGEIYNYQDIQQQFAREEIPLKTRSDIETALHLYKQHGISLLNICAECLLLQFMMLKSKN